jgi:hypothetical protein
MAESWSTRRTRWAKRRQSILEAVGGTAHPEVLVPLRHTLVADAEGVNAPRRRHESLRVGEDVQVRRSPQAAAGRKRDAEARGRLHRRLGGGSVAGWYTALEARQGNPGHGTMPEPGPRRGTLDRQAEKYGAKARPPDAVGQSSHASYSERGTATSMGQDGTEGRSPHRTLAPDPVGPDARKPTARRGLAAKANADQRHRCRDRYRCLHVALLLDCWDDLNKDAASGGDGVTWPRDADTLPTNVAAVVERLKRKRYRAKRMRRHDLPKGDGQERP